MIKLLKILGRIIGCVSLLSGGYWIAHFDTMSVISGLFDLAIGVLLIYVTSDKE